jgi:4-alpha-glucanotransferase
VRRRSGILLHPTSLPGRFGIGDLGPEAHAWVDFLADAGCGLWQVLPLGPTGFGDSPYQTFSAFAGNPLLVSPELLVSARLLGPGDLLPPRFPSDYVDFGRVIPWKTSLLDEAYDRFSRRKPDAASVTEFERFRRRRRSWLSDYALFAVLKDESGGRPWVEWDRPLRDRDEKTLARFRRAHRRQLNRVAFHQYLFFTQWKRLRRHAARKRIRLVGDIPIFVAQDSAEVWANRHLFDLDGRGHPRFVAGVPPDYFSDTGQLWGNPLYRWSVHRRSGFRWWVARVRATLELVDAVRLDHFRGFYDYWEIPAGAPTAMEGRWRPGPREALFDVLAARLGGLPFVAEDLGGDMGPGIPALREKYGLPGMKVTSFAFYHGPDHEFLPHNYDNPNWVAYTGTHDNQTARGWIKTAPAGARRFAFDYLDASEETFVAELVRATWASVAGWAVTPMQDLLDLGDEARMNKPATKSGNWRWRMPARAASKLLGARLRKLNQTYGRLG